MSARSLVRLSLVHMLPGFLRAEAIDVEGVFALAGLPPPVERSMADALVARAQICTLLERCSAMTGDPLVGVRLVRHGVDPSQLGMFGAALFQGGKLRDCLRSVARFSPTLHQDIDLDIAESGDRACWSQRIRGSDPEDVSVLSEACCFFIVDVMRAFVAPDWAPRFVRFPHKPRTHSRRYEEQFGAPVTFGGGDATLIGFDASCLDIKTAPARRWRSFEIPPPDELGERFRTLDQTPCGVSGETLVESVSRVIDGLMMADNLSIPRAARSLGYSQRSLQRSLAALNCSFETLVERRRRQRSVELLSDPRTKVVEVAMALAYSDSAHFIRAFQKWNGKSPTEYRRALTQH